MVSSTIPLENRDSIVAIERLLLDEDLTSRLDHIVFKNRTNAKFQTITTF